MTSTPADPTAPGRSRIQIIGLILALIVASASMYLLTAAQPAEAHHGVFSHWQESRDSGSCCVDVRSVSRCSTSCGWLQSNIKHSGSWVQSTCDSRPNDTCGTHRGPYRSYSYPSTVETAGWYLAGSHSGGNPSHKVTYS